MRLSRPSIGLALLLALGCEGEPPTEVLVVIDAEMALIGRITELTVTVQGGPNVGALTEVLAPTTLSPPTFPVEVAIVPRGGDASRAFGVEAVARAGTEEVGTVRARGDFVSNRLVQIPLLLEACCETVAPTCTAEETCRRCLCTPDVITPLDGGTIADGGLDASAPIDASVDGPVGDAGPPDPCSEMPIMLSALATGPEASLALVGLSDRFVLVFTGSDGSAPVTAFLELSVDGTVTGGPFVGPPGGQAVSAAALADGSVIFAARRADDQLEVGTFRDGFVVDGDVLATTGLVLATSLAVHPDGRAVVAYITEAGSSSNLYVVAFDTLPGLAAAGGPTTVGVDADAPVITARGPSFDLAWKDSLSGGTRLQLVNRSAGVVGTTVIPALATDAVAIGSLSGTTYFVGVRGSTTTLAALDSGLAVTGSVTYPYPSPAYAGFGFGLEATAELLGHVRSGITGSGHIYDAVWFRGLTVLGSSAPTTTDTDRRDFDIGVTGERWAIVTVKQMGGPVTFQGACPSRAGRI